MGKSYVVLKGGVDLASENSKVRIAKPLLAYAENLGFGAGVLIELAPTSDAAWMEDGNLVVADVLDRLQSGDHLVFRCFLSISRHPHTIVALVRWAVARGVAVHTLSCGRLSQYADALAEFSALVADSEQEIENAKLEAERAVADAEDVAFRMVGEKVREMMRNSSFTVQLQPPKETGDCEEVGAYIKHLRERAHLTQRELAAKLGTEQGSVSRAEKSGSGSVAVAAIALLDPDGCTDLNNPSARKSRAIKVLAAAQRAGLTAE